MKKILITGVSGLLGSNLAYCWRNRYDILGIYHQHPWAFAGIRTKQADLADSQAVKALLKDFEPDVIIHAAASVDVDRCEEDPQWAWRGNEMMTQCLVNAADSQTKFVYISTDLVYDGVRGGYVETDPVNLINVYATTKFAGEQAVVAIANALIVRTNIFGWNVQDKTCFAERVIKEAKARTINGFTDSFFSSLYTFDLAELLSAALEKDLKGIYHFASSTAVSRYDFADSLAKKLGYGSGLIHSSSMKVFPFKARRSPNLSLNTDKLQQAIESKIVTAENSIDHYVADYKNGIVSKLKGEVA